MNALARWEAPFIRPHRPGAINKFGLRAARDDFIDSVDGIPVEDLVARYGSPLFITSEASLRKRIRTVRRAFGQRYPDVVHGWSYKTNYTSAICNIFHQEGSWAEVVSRFEYEKARSLGVPGRRILLNGPHKPRELLERALDEGARIHVDHLDELELLESVAAEHDRQAPVTLRLNFSTGYTEPWSRFGFNLESGQAHQAARRVNSSPHLRLVGLHSHIGTFILDPRAYTEQIRIMTAFAAELESDGEVLLESLDVGGGLPSTNALQGIYLPPEQAVPPLEDYAESICSAVHRGMAYRRDRGQPMPRLFFESGRAMVDDCQVLVASVVGTKRLPDGRRAAVLDAGVNVLFTSYWYNHRVKTTRPCSGLPEETVLYGPLCMNIDVMRHSLELPPLAVGDRLVFSPVGAYNNTQWMQFIEYRPAVVLIHKDGEASVIREAEDLEVMCSQDRVPAHLRQPLPPLDKLQEVLR